jgi:chorismate-pyruvate lyase
MKIEEFLRDSGSTTGYFKQLTDDYGLEILRHGIIGDTFERAIAIYLNKAPCMLAVSKTKVEYPCFFEILQNAGDVSIGTKLFAPDSGITRTNLQISKINLKDIEHKEIVNFIHKMNYNLNELYYRKSDFIYQQQKMHLDEYVLPSLIEILVDF